MAELEGKAEMGSFRKKDIGGRPGPRKGRRTPQSDDGQRTIGHGGIPFEERLFYYSRGGGTSQGVSREDEAGLGRIRSGHFRPLVGCQVKEPL